LLPDKIWKFNIVDLKPFSNGRVSFDDAKKDKKYVELF